MPTAQQDTEITLGTGRMLAIFFAFVLVCALFFAIGFSLGRKTLATSTAISSATGVTPAAIVRPSAAKNDSHPSPQSSDFGFYKAVGGKSSNASLASPDAKAEGAPASPPQNAANAVPDASSGSPVSGGYYVQVAAVTRQEDADSLVEALKKKQYPAFTASNPSVDKYFRVQVGPYGDIKEAEAMRARLISDGYNPIVKK
jgi:cell division septation protein DedD